MAEKRRSGSGASVCGFCAAAKAAGMQAWLFCGGSHLARIQRGAEGADRVFDSMAAFFETAPNLAR